MIIAQISDSHIDPESDKLKDRLTDLRRVVDNINIQDPTPDIVIHTGDVVHNGTQEKYDLALTILRDVRAPLHVCPGNRDDRDLISKNFHTIKCYMIFFSGRQLALGKWSILELFELVKRSAEWRCESKLLNFTRW